MRSLKLVEIARRLGCSEPWVSLIERGVKLPGGWMAIEIQRLTGIDPDDWPKPDRKPRKRKEAA